MGQKTLLPDDSETSRLNTEQMAGYPPFPESDLSVSSVATEETLAG